jgi:hypothetical protein
MSPRSSTPLQLLTHRFRLITPEPLAHIHHPPLTIAVAPLQLLTLRGKGIDEWGAQTVGGEVSLDEDAVGGLQAGCESGS